MYMDRIRGSVNWDGGKCSLACPSILNMGNNKYNNKYHSSIGCVCDSGRKMKFSYKFTLIIDLKISFMLTDASLDLIV